MANADSLDVASVLGWKVVVKRGQFKRGDLVVYIEIDSILPERPEFEFMRAKHFKVKTVKLRGQISQGIVFPLSILPVDCGELYEGRDITELLGVTKVEQIEPHGLAKGNFPDFIPKTDETRVQVLQKVLTACAGDGFEITEKLDGCSVTFYMYNGQFGVCSRNLELQDGGNVYWEMARKYNIAGKLAGMNLALQGEIIGEKIQGNKYKIKGSQVFFFNVFDINSGVYHSPFGTTEMLASLGLQQVPIVGLIALPDDIDKIVEMAKGKSVIADCKREGIVLRKTYGQRLSFKAINPEFLLKYGE